MPDDVDLFVLYRWMLATVCVIYTGVCTVRSVWGWLDFFGQTRRHAVLGRYAGVLLLRVRIRRFGWDLCQITALLAILGYLVHAHRSLIS